MKQAIKGTHWEPLWNAVEELANEYGLKHRFLESLYETDDWTFTIKVHAFIESCVNTAIDRCIEDKRVSGILTQLNLNGKTSRIAVLKSIELLEPNDIKLRKAISTLRNRVVHKISNSDFRISEFIESLKEEEYKSLLHNLLIDFSQDTSTEITFDKLKSFFMKDPKFFLMLGFLRLVALLSARTELIELTRQRDALELNLLKQVSEQLTQKD